MHTARPRQGRSERSTSAQLTGRRNSSDKRPLGGYTVPPLRCGGSHARLQAPPGACQDRARKRRQSLHLAPLTPFARSSQPPFLSGHFRYDSFLHSHTSSRTTVPQVLHSRALFILADVQSRRCDDQIAGARFPVSNGRLFKLACGTAAREQHRLREDCRTTKFPTLDEWQAQPCDASSCRPLKTPGCF